MANDFDLQEFQSTFGQQKTISQDLEEQERKKQALKTKTTGFDQESFNKTFGKQEEAPIITTDGETVFDGSSPHTAIADSPVDLITRVQLQFGNRRGNLAALKKGGFSDAKYAEGKGLTVQKEDGRWYQVDPGKLDPTADSWQLTEQLMDGVEFASSMAIPLAAETIGTAVGTVVGGVAGVLGGGPLVPATTPTGAALGGAAGFVAGAYLGAKANQSLGRLFGTYEATPEEASNDIMWETIFNMGGYAVMKLGGAAMKNPGIRKAVRETFETVSSRPEVAKALGALDNIKNFASGNVKEVVKNVIKASGVDDGAAKQLIEDPMGVNRIMSKYLRSNGGLKSTSDEVVGRLKTDNIGHVKKLYEKAGEYLTKGFRKREAELLSDPALKNVVVNRKQVVDEMMTSLAESGVVKATKNSKNQLTGWAIQSSKDIERLLKAGGDADVPILRDQAKEQIIQLVKMANKMRIGGEQTGRKGVRDALKLRRQVADLYMKATKANPELRSILGKPTSEARQGLAKVFGSDGKGGVTQGMENVARKFRDMNDFFIKNRDHVVDADRIAKISKPGTGNSTIEAHLTQMFKGAKESAGLTFKAITDMADDEGKEVAKLIKNTHAGSQFIKKMPHFKSGGATNLAGNVMKAATAPVTSPRIQARAMGGVMMGKGAIPAGLMANLPYMKSLRDTVSALTNDDKRALLADPAAFPEAVQRMKQALDARDNFNR